MSTEVIVRKAERVVNEIRWYRVGILVALIAVIMNTNTMIFKATHLIRGDLVGDQLEYALLLVVSVHTLLLIGQGYLLCHFHKSIKVLKGG